MTTNADGARRHGLTDKTPTLGADRLEHRVMTDKERMDWLESAMENEHPCTPMYENGAWGYPYLVSGTPSGGGVGFASFGSLREAIDAAMKWD